MLRSTQGVARFSQHASLPPRPRRRNADCERSAEEVVLRVLCNWVTESIMIEAVYGGLISAHGPDQQAAGTRRRRFPPHFRMKIAAKSGPWANRIWSENRPTRHLATPDACES